MKTDLTPAVAAIEQIDLTGNVIPPSWYHEIKTDSGKTALLAINILADIVYWYKPTIRRNEMTGQVASKKKKFKFDKLQKNYRHYAEFFGVPKDTVTDAFDLLVKRELITREFRTIHVNGVALNNVMFVEPIPATIAEITFRTSTPMVEKPDRVVGENSTTLPDEIPTTLPPILGETNTETTTGITTETTTAAAAENLAWLSQKYTSEIGMIPNMIVADEIKDWSALPREWLEYGFSQLAEANEKAKANKESPIRSRWSYVKSIFRACQEAGQIPVRADQPNGAAKGGSKTAATAAAALAEYGRAMGFT